MQRRKVDICVLTEVKQKEKGNKIIGDYIHIYSGVPKDVRAKRGVSIIIHKKLKKNIKIWEEVKQIIKLEMTKNGRHIIIIGIYATSDDAEKIINDHFYDKLSNTL